jgi:hypothetical protein
MTIYKITRGAGSRFRMMRFVDEAEGNFDKWEHLLRPESIAADWVPPRLRFYEPGETGIRGDSTKRPRSTATDMPYVYGHGLLVVSARLVERCGTILGACGEFLPVDSSAGAFFAYHCTNVIDCLDVEASRLSRSRIDGRILNVYDPVFRPESLTPATVFRLPVGNTEVVFCGERVYDALIAPPLRGVTADVAWPTPEPRRTGL